MLLYRRISRYLGWEQKERHVMFAHPWGGELNIVHQEAGR